MPKAADAREFVSYHAVRTANTAVREKSSAGKVLRRDTRTGQFVVRERVTGPSDSARVTRRDVMQFSKVRSKR